MKIEQITSKEQWDALVKAAGKDNHTPYAATHYFVQDNEIVGSFNVGLFVNWWLRTDKKFKDTAKAGLLAQRALKKAGINNPIFMVATTSPYLPHMERLGFVDSEIDFRYFVQTQEFQDVLRKQTTKAA